MIKTILHYAWKYAPVVWELYKKWKEYEREFNANEIRENPSKAWDNRFKRDES